MEKQFDEKIKLHGELNLKEEKVYEVLGNLKVMTFIVLIVIFFLNKNQSVIGYIFNIIVLLGLIALFVLQYKVSLKIKYHNNIIKINQKYIDRINSDWYDFKDDGKEFLDKNHEYGYDLDIVGERSLFQMINIAHTYLGRQKFAKKLLYIDTTENEIILNQGATSELSEKVDFIQNFENISMEIDDNNSIKEIIQYLAKKDSFFKNKLFNTLIHFLPVITILLLAIELIFKPRLFVFISGLLVGLQLILWGVGSSKISNYLNKIAHLSLKFNSYEELFKLVKRNDFNSEKLKTIKNNLFSDVSATDAMRELSSLNQKINLRHNFIIYFLLNMLLLWDYECCFALEKWRSKYSDYIGDWFDNISELESLLSFSVLGNVIPKTSYPVIIENMTIKTINIGHPLINNKSRIYNDMTLNDEIMIVSGSNMSGKTTFLRTLGVNLILSYNGSTVCGDSLTTPIVDIVTSMRIADDLSEGISTFYAELLKIKRIINRSKKDKKMLFLIDEIFRGTNSKDRLFGAKTVIENLNDKGAIGLITTHDIEITELEKNKRIINYHFKEEYINEKINFDYKLRKGISTTTNGIELMKLVGITL